MTTFAEFISNAMREHHKNQKAKIFLESASVTKQCDKWRAEALEKIMRIEAPGR